MNKYYTSSENQGELYRDDYLQAMTICIAAIYEDSGIIGAADRALTYGDINFQNGKSKVYKLTDNAVELVAGNVSIHPTVYEALKKEIEKSGITNISDMASMFVNESSKYKIKMELAQIGQLIETPRSAAENIIAEEVKRITSNSIINPPKGQELLAIIAGIDESGTHIYQMINTRIDCKDMAGYACMGLNYISADNQIVSLNYERIDSKASVLWKVYQAKRSAEIASNIGKDTHMFIIDKAKGFRFVPKYVMDILKSNYDLHLEVINQSTKKIEDVLNEGIKTNDF